MEGVLFQRWKAQEVPFPPSRHRFSMSKNASALPCRSEREQAESKGFCWADALPDGL